jgi:hypothetical protein
MGDSVGYEVIGFLEGLLLGAAPAGADVAAAPVFCPDGEPADVGAGADCDFAAWVQRPGADGRMGWEPPDLPEAARWWARADADESPEASPCPRCGSLEAWQIVAGGWRCQHCDAGALERGMALLERAARLREQSPALRPLRPAGSGRYSGPARQAALSDAFPGP